MKELVCLTFMFLLSLEFEFECFLIKHVATARSVAQTAIQNNNKTNIAQ